MALDSLGLDSVCASRNDAAAAIVNVFALLDRDIDRVVESNLCFSDRKGSGGWRATSTRTRKLWRCMATASVDVSNNGKGR